MRRRLVAILAVAVVIAVTAAGPALACGGLVAPNGSVNLVKTTTLSAYFDGVEHYITSFEFAGVKSGKFGSIVPLPDVPTDVERAGRWTLQRLVQEVTPVPEGVAFAASDAAGLRSEAEVIMTTRVSALDITVLKGGGDEVGRWAKSNGFFLPPDAPEVLDFYADRSPIFMAVKFNLKRAASRDITAGDGIPIQVTIPTDQPWVPLRILSLGRGPEEIVEADVFTLTDEIPAMLPFAGLHDGMDLPFSGEASQALLADLRSDRNMDWLPASDVWLNYISLSSQAKDLTYDLALNVDGGAPSPVDAGFDNAPSPVPSSDVNVMPWLVALAVGAAAVLMSTRVATKR
jgi:hypothetical protein